MIHIFVLLLLPFMAQAETLRVATFNTELGRDGPGLLLRDIAKGDPQVAAVVRVLAQTRPDIVALQGIDWDLNGRALTALAGELAQAGLSYPYHFADRPNAGFLTPFDLDGDGRTGGPGDAQGWGRFSGQNGIAVLSRYPILTDKVRSFSDLLWRDLPGARLPVQETAPFPSKQAQSVQKLSSTAHWVVPVQTPSGALDILTFHASPPVFDGPEDRNGLRNRDELRLWSLLLSGAMGPAPNTRFVIAGDANLDPALGEGHKQAIKDLLRDPAVQDVQPRDPQGSLATVSWKAVGELRVDYVLPSADWTVVDAGIFWPTQGSDGRRDAETASRHRLVWVDLATD